MQGDTAMRVAIYARVSTDAQEARGTIGSQLALLRERVTQEKGTNRSLNTSMTASPARAWTVPVWTPCATLPKPDTSRACGVCRPTAWLACTPIRSSFSTNWPAMA